MISLIEDSLPKHAFFCDTCGEKIVQKREVLLLRRRDSGAGGELYHVHADCVERHVRGQMDLWERTPLLSPRAAQLLR